MTFPEKNVEKCARLTVSQAEFQREQGRVDQNGSDLRLTFCSCHEIIRNYIRLKLIQLSRECVRSISKNISLRSDAFVRVQQVQSFSRD